MNNIDNKKTDEKDELFYKGLSNYELVMIFHKFKEYYDNLNINLNNNTITKPIKTPMGIGMIVKEVPKEHVEKFKDSTYYKTLVNIIAKLEPVANLIEDCDEEIKEFAKKLKNTKDE